MLELEKIFLVIITNNTTRMVLKHHTWKEIGEMFPTNANVDDKSFYADKCIKLWRLRNYQNCHKMKKKSLYQDRVLIYDLFKYSMNK